MSHDSRVVTPEDTTEATTEATQETTQETTQEKILRLLAQHPQMTREQLAGALGLTADGIKYHLEKMKKSNRLKRHGSTKSGYWEVI